MNTSETVSTVNRLPPSLSHSASSGSSATLPHFSSSASTPATIYSAAIGSAPELSPIPGTPTTASEKLEKEQQMQMQMQVQAQQQREGEAHEAQAPIELGSPQAPDHVQTSTQGASGAGGVAASDSESVRQRRLRTERSLQQARELAQGRSVQVEEDEDEAERAKGFAAWLDRHALK